MLKVWVMFLKEDSIENMHTNYYNEGQLAKMIRMIRKKVSIFQSEIVFHYHKPSVSTKSWNDA